MEATHQSKSSVDEKTKHIARWVLGIVFVIGGLGSVKDQGFLSALFVSLGGLVILPPIVDRINAPLKGKFGFTSQIVVVFFLFMLGAVSSTSTPKEEPLTIEQVQQIVDEALAEQAQTVEDSKVVPLEATPTEEVSEEPEKSEAMKDVEREISSKEAEISKLEGWIETFDCPFDEYQRINDMYFAAGNMNANKDQFFINVWQGEINELEVELNSLEAQLQALQ